MKKYNILVTAVGAIVGYGIIEALRLSAYDVNIIGCDIFPDAVGRYFADDFVVAEPAASNKYIDFLKNLIEEKDIHLVIFGIEQEINAVSAERENLGHYIDKLVLNPKNIVDISDDKWITREWLFDNNLSKYAIDSVIEGDFEEVSSRFGLPFLIKPRVSRAGKGIAEISLPADFYYYKNKLGANFMAQKIAGDAEHEYTVGVFGDGDGGIINYICLNRKLSQEGATAKARVAYDKEIEFACRDITAALKPSGPLNYQFRKQGETVYLLEINPRVSSSVSIRSKLGYNEAEMCIDYFLEKKRPAKAIIKNGKAIRYITDWMIEE